MQTQEEIIDNVVEINNLYKTYIMGNNKIEALKSINLDIRKGEYIVIMGPSGSGKTTLLNMIGALDTPTSGSCTIDGYQLSDLNEKELSSIRVFKIGFVFQTFNLIDSLTALDNVAFPQILAGKTNTEAHQRAAEVLDIVGLADRMDHFPQELSGGQQQRVAIARAIVNETSIILADEPTANLDLETGMQIVKLLRRLNRELGVTIINTTHDLKLIDIADRICWLRDGEITRKQKRIVVELTSDEITLPI